MVRLNVTVLRTERRGVAPPATVEKLRNHCRDIRESLKSLPRAATDQPVRCALCRERALLCADAQSSANCASAWISLLLDGLNTRADAPLAAIACY